MRTKLWNRNKKGVLGLEFGFLPAVLVLVILTGLAAVGYGAASGSNSEALLPSEIRVFDPFILSSTMVVLERSSASGLRTPESIHLRADPVVRVPFRPELRSPFRPPAVSVSQQES